MTTSLHIAISVVDGGDHEAIAASAADALLALGGTPTLDSALALAHSLLTRQRQIAAHRRMVHQATAPLRAQLAALEATVDQR